MKRLFTLFWTILLMLFQIELFAQCPTSPHVSLFSQADVDDFVQNWSTCTDIPGHFYIGGINNSNSDITDISGLSFVDQVGFNLRIERNPQLVSLDGLENIDTVGILTISRNDRLKNLNGLNQGMEISGILGNDPRINIGSNDSLLVLDGLNFLPQDGSVILSLRKNDTLNLSFTPFITNLKRLHIDNNNGPSAIVELTGFSNLDSIDQLEIEAVPSLLDLKDLNPNLVISSSLILRNNQNLSICSTPAVCNFINNGGSAGISGNAAGCVNITEIINNCDSDGDGINECIDNCPGIPNPNQVDFDSDGIGDVCDNCPIDSNSNQADMDLDTIGDVCDNCPTDSNPSQEDMDLDLIGDACDNCPNDSNSNQEDTDSDSIGDACDNCPNDMNSGQEDGDVDNVGDVCDNCPSDSNANQEDTDSDSIGDACDNCPDNMNSGQEDGDSDGVGDICDNCPTDSNPNQEDTDSDSIGDACDNCPNDMNSGQEDGDSDGVGDICDNCPSDSNPNQEDTDSDSIGDLCDNCPTVSNPGQEDQDNNGIGDACQIVNKSVEIQGGALFINSNQSLVLKGDDGKCYQVKIDSSGNLIHFEISCPN